MVIVNMEESIIGKNQNIFKTKVSLILGEFSRPAKKKRHLKIETIQKERSKSKHHRRQIESKAQ